MDTAILQRLKAAATPESRAAVLLNMSLSALPEDLLRVVYTAAIPHWFNAHFLAALLGNKSDEPYNRLLRLSFVEQVPGQGYAIHELTRGRLLSTLWQGNRKHFRALSGRAADYCLSEGKENDAIVWQAEEIYHRLVSDPEAGVDGLRNLATRWANYEYHTYEEIEYVVRLAGEQIEAGRLTGEGAAWTRLWQAKLALIYGRNGQSDSPIFQISLQPDTDISLAAEIAQTRGDWLAKVGDRAGMESAWRRAYDLYLETEDGKLDAYLITEKLRQEGLPLPEVESEPELTTLIPPNQDALRLIDNIEVAWIDGVLKTTLKTEIDINMARDSNRPSNILFHRPQSLDRPLVGEHRLSRLFEAAGGSLLILGAPGSGKTITLLQLLEELLAVARLDRKVPIPLLFNLSSFANFARGKKVEDIDLSDWLAEQAYNQYRLKRNTTKEELIAGRFILLLDGLDEVSAEDGLREQCVTSINEFIQEMPCGLVVCSRIGDYQTLQNKLALAHALVLQPLNNRQIETFIAQVPSKNREAMQAAIRSDWKLREVLRSPLLLNLFPQAYPLLSSSMAEETSLADTIEFRRQGLFAAYVDTVFDQSPPSPSQEKGERFTKEKSMKWLTFLANRMQQAGTSLFNIEELQPTWLPRTFIGRYRAMYGYFHILFILPIVGLVIALIGGIIGTISGDLAGTLIASLISFLVFGLIGQFGGVAAVLITTNIKRPRLRAGTGGLITGLIVVQFGGFVGILIGVLLEPSSFGFIAGLVIGVIIALIIGLLVGSGIFISNSIASWATKIQLRERVRPTRPNRRRIVYYLVRFFIIGLIGGLLFGAFGGLIGGLIVWLTTRIGEIFTSMPGPFWDDFLSEGYLFGLYGGFYSALIFGSFFGLLGGLFGTLLAFINTPQVDERPKPGSGVRPSLRNAILISIVAALFFGLPSVFVDLVLIETGFLIPIIVWVNLLPPTFTWFGGLAWCQHWVLRFILYWRGWLPWRLVPWLDEMTERGLLRRVGGGYIFIHRSLLEYFANLYEGPEASVEV